MEKNNPKGFKRGHGPAPRDEDQGAEGEEARHRLQGPRPGEAEEEAEE